MPLFNIEYRLRSHVKRLLMVLRDLADENIRLRQKEQVMLSFLQDQEDSLYRFSCLALSGEWSTKADNDAVLQAAATDVKAYELLQYAGHADSCMPAAQCDGSSPGSAANTRRLRAAVTPDALLAVQSASTKDLALRLQQLTRRLALLRMVNASGQPAELRMADSLESAVEEYGKFCMSLHIGAHCQCMELCCLNLDTLQQGTPPTGHWALVAAQVGLTCKQIEGLAVAFQVYQEKRLPLVAEAQQTVQRLQQLQGNTDAVSNAAGAADPRMAAVAIGAGLLMPEECGAALHQATSWVNFCAQAQAHLQLATSSTVASCSTSQRQQSCNTGVGLHAWGKNVSEQVDELLQHLLGLTKRMRELARHVTMHWVNTLTTEQMAAAITASYPFWTQPVLLCEVLWRQQQQQRWDCSAGTDAMSACSMS